MLIVCPSCATSYEVQPAALGAAGRSVRCTRCQTLWFASPTGAPVSVGAAAGTEAGDASVAAFKTELGRAATADEPPPDTAATAEPAPADNPPDLANPSIDDLIAANETGAADQPSPDAPAEPPPAAEALHDLSFTDMPPFEAPPLAPQDDGAPQPIAARAEPADIETFAARRSPRSRRKPAPKRRNIRMPGLPVVIVTFIGMIAALLAWRGEVVRHVPQLASLYAAIRLPVNLRGLVFAEVKTATDIHDGVPVLVVEGSVVNATSGAVDVPRLRFSVRNGSGAEIYAWTAPPTQPVLGPGETLPFRSRLAAPPTESRDVLVRFYNRRDAVAGLR